MGASDLREDPVGASGIGECPGRNTFVKLTP